MATYKVLQDIEAEDKLLGPLTLKQFIFAIITLLLGFLAYLFGQINILLIIPWLFPMSFFAFMAAPINKDQPNDVWLAARIRFLIKPRKRVWDQAGIQELVTITAPKKVEIRKTDGLSQKEVKSRLAALSSVMDTRGWAVKNLDSAPERFQYMGQSNSGDRLLNLYNDGVGEVVIKPSEDILDTENNSVAQRFDSAIKKHQLDKINYIKEKMKANLLESDDKEINQEPANFDFILNDTSSTEPGYARFGTQVISPKSASDSNSKTLSIDNKIDDEGEILGQIHHNQEIQKQIINSSHEHRISPLNETEKNNKEVPTNQPPTDVILKQLSQANDISVASIASLAQRNKQESELENNDTISLH